MKQYPHEFSGGMRQRTLIAIGLAARPKLLIADEPTSALDVTVQRQILDHLEGLTAELGTAVLLITHDLGLAAERAEHLVVMYKGQVVESGPARRILCRPAPPLHAPPGRVGALPGRPAQRHRRRSRGGRRARGAGRRRPRMDGAAGRRPRPPAAADDVLTIENLTKVYKIRGAGGPPAEFKAVDDVSFSVRRGTTTAVVGESGSGKSTLAQMVLRSAGAHLRPGRSSTART